MPILLLINMKGGVGKTACTVALAEAISQSGKKTLVIDADHQAMSGHLLLDDFEMERAEDRRRTLPDLLLSLSKKYFDDNFSDFVTDKARTTRPGMLSVIPCSFRLDEFWPRAKRANPGVETSDLRDRINRRMKLFRDWISEKYDFVLVDCPPYLADHVRLFLRNADGYLLPSVPDPLSINGSKYFMERLAKRPREYRLVGVGTIWTLVREIALHEQSMDKERRDTRLPEPFTAKIRHTTDVAGALADCNCLHKPPTFKGKWGRAASDYEQLAQELIERCAKQFSWVGRKQSDSRPLYADHVPKP